MLFVFSSNVRAFPHCRCRLRHDAQDSTGCHSPHDGSARSYLLADLPRMFDDVDMLKLLQSSANVRPSLDSMMQVSPVRQTGHDRVDDQAEETSASRNLLWHEKRVRDSALLEMSSLEVDGLARALWVPFHSPAMCLVILTGNGSRLCSVSDCSQSS
jgi:hypothetical protein